MDGLDALSSPDLAARFRHRIGFPAERALFAGETGSRVDRDALDAFLVAAGRSIPFENLALMDGGAEKINPTTIAAKILDRWEGGLCYEINPLLALALRAEGFDARVIRATIADPDTDDGWFPLSRTHVTALLPIGGGLFLADAGFGLKQPLGLVPWATTKESAHRTAGIVPSPECRAPNGCSSTTTAMAGRTGTGSRPTTGSRMRRRWTRSAISSPIGASRSSTGDHWWPCRPNAAGWC